MKYTLDIVFNDGKFDRRFFDKFSDLVVYLYDLNLEFEYVTIHEEY